MIAIWRICRDLRLTDSAALEAGAAIRAYRLSPGEEMQA
jgi:hypothetical protein